MNLFYPRLKIVNSNSLLKLKEKYCEIIEKISVMTDISPSRVPKDHRVKWKPVVSLVTRTFEELRRNDTRYFLCK